VQVDDETAQRVQEFADMISIAPEEAAGRLLRIAASVREGMKSRGLLEGGIEGDFVVSMTRSPDGVTHIDFRRLG
jgi:hypothetical protein